MKTTRMPAFFIMTQRLFLFFWCLYWLLNLLCNWPDASGVACAYDDRALDHVIADQASAKRNVTGWNAGDDERARAVRDRAAIRADDGDARPGARLGAR